MTEPLEELRAEYRELINSMEFAYAMGHSRTLGDDPRLQPVLDRVDQLRRTIAALERETQASERPPSPPLREPD